MVVRKVIIPAAGLGTRLFPATKVQPKEMLPIFSKSASKDISVKPMVQVVFEQLYSAGLREFCFVVGRGKRANEDHFTADPSSIKTLNGTGKSSQAKDLEDFYEKLNDSTIMWVNQSEPKGFGNAVLMAKPFVQNETCLVHAGDGCLLSGEMDYVKRLLDAFERFRADAAFIVLDIKDPKQYGIVEGTEIEKGIINVSAVTEKPEKPKTNWAIMAMYVFNPVIFKALEATKPGKNGEIQLTDAIQKLVEWGLKVIAVKLDNTYQRLDIGTPEVYYDALNTSYKHILL